MIKEKSVQDQIIKSIREKGFYAINVNSGAMLKKYGKSVYKIELAPKGTPDIIACIEGEFVGIEVKKSQKERLAWKKIIENYVGGLKEFKSHEQAIQQFKTGSGIAESGGKYICVYSVEHFRRCRSSRHEEK